MRPGGSILLVLALLGAPAVDADDDVRRAADDFGRALTSSNLKKLRPILPDRGRVRVQLARLGPEDGSFGAEQVEAILGDFLARGVVESFEVVRVEGDDRTYALVRGRASVVDGSGRAGHVGLHLSFEREADRWVLREIKETKE